MTSIMLSDTICFASSASYAIEKLEERHKTGAAEHGRVRSDLSETLELLVGAGPLAPRTLRARAV